MIKDSTPEKWEYREHTRVKHEILGKYLHPWIVKLGSVYPKVLFIDGFAGKGEYKDEITGKIEPKGSPVIALKVANRLLEQAEEKKRNPCFDEFVCICIEKNKDNFNNLKNVINKEKEKLKFKDKLQVDIINDEFANVVNEIYNSVGARIAPSFFFIDPFGFSGVPFEIIKKTFIFTKNRNIFYIYDKLYRQVFII